MEVGLQFTLHLQNKHPVTEIVGFARQAHDLGFDQIWVNDNLRWRSNFVAMTAIASHVPIRLGTAIMVPYFRNPIDVADILATLSELTEGRAPRRLSGSYELLQHGPGCPCPSCLSPERPHPFLLRW